MGLRLLNEADIRKTTDILRLLSDEAKGRC
jgi:hypothetical protein